MANMSNDMLVVIKNVRKLLQDSSEGFEINKLPTSYFNKFGRFAYPDKMGYKNWGEMLNHPEIQTYAEFYNNSLWVRMRASATPAPPASVTNVTVLQPVSKPIAQQSNGVADSPSVKKPPPSSQSECSSNASSKRKAKLLNRPGEKTSATMLGKRAGSESSKSSKSSKRTKDVFNEAKSDSESDFSEATHVSISDYNRQKLNSDRAKIQWIPRDNSNRQLNFNTLILERQVQNAEESFYIDTTFCEKHILENLMHVKNRIRSVTSDKFTAVRSQHNIFEFQKGAIFQHGAAIKMANIDALMGMALSSPKAPDGSNLIQSNELLYFVDVNGGPGGYAEYFLWKKKWQAKGFGITLRGGNDYNLEQAEHFPRESFETFYGENATEGTGDIGKPYYLSKFVSFVKDSTDQRGVHVMIASGGEKSNTTDEDQKEIRCKYIFLAEFLVALKVIREGGHFVCRIYDMYTPFTVGLIYLMYRTFEQVAVYKPESCMPASSEKYVLCKWKKPDYQVNEIANYLSECHKIDWLSKRSKKGSSEGFAEITHLFSIQRMRESFRFHEYIKRTNAELGKRQHDETERLAISIRDGIQDRNIQGRLADIQHKSLNLWGIPDRVREKAKYSKATTPAIRAVKLLTPYAYDFIETNGRDGEMEMSMRALLTELKNPKEWSFMPVGRERGFFMCLGGRQIYKYDEGEWKLVSEPLELMNNTLVYADLVDEFEIKGSKQTIWTGFHIIDALILGGKDIRDLPSNERSDLIAKFSRSMNKASRDDLSAIRPKLTYDLKDTQKFFATVKEYKVRNRDGKITTNYLCPVDKSGVNEIKFLVDGVLFMKRFKANFVSADFRFCVQNRVYWQWNDKVNLTVPKDFVPGPIENFYDEDQDDDDNVVPVHAVTLLQHLFQCKQD